MKSITTAIDWVQAGDLGYYMDRDPKVIEPGKTIRTQLSLIRHDQLHLNQALGSNWLGPVAESGLMEFISQPLEQSVLTQVVGRVVKTSVIRRPPDKYNPKGLTIVEVLLASEKIPFKINWIVEGLRDIEVPSRNDLIHECGAMMCEPSFYVGDLFSPVTAKITDVLKCDNKGKDLSRDFWAIASLQIDPRIRKPDHVVYNHRGNRAIRV